jgi:hypothetical protein
MAARQADVCFEEKPAAALARDGVSLIQYLVIARSEATKQSSAAAPHWIASLRSQ